MNGYSLKNWNSAFPCIHQLNPQDQIRIANLLPTLIEGMEFDQVQFQEHAKGEVHGTSHHERFGLLHLCGGRVRWRVLD